MLARSTLRATARVGSVTVSAPSNERGMATLRELEMRLKSMKNMEKITKVRVLINIISALYELMILCFVPFSR
jgi:F-type H+-transporting ATPase subunit gamma